MGATSRYGFRWPDGTASPNLRTLLKNLSEDVEGRLATVEDAGGGIARVGGTAFTGEISATQYRFGATGSEVVLVQESVNPPILRVLNPGASLWATIKAAAFAVQSSRRYKENIRATRYRLADLLQLRPVDYHYREGHGDPNVPQTGLIAEEVAGVFPEAVTFDADGQPDGVDYAKLVPLLIRAVQQLAEQVEHLSRGDEAP